MTNNIKINAVDNELYVVAYQFDRSYQIAHIKSGNRKKVDVSIDIKCGVYTKPDTIDGVVNDILEKNTVFIPVGEYKVVAVGVNWGAVWDFSLSVNGKALSGSAKSGDGVVWSTEGDGINLIVDADIPTVGAVDFDKAHKVPVGLGFLSDSNKVIPFLKYNGLTYYAYSYKDNRYSFSLVAYDHSGSMVSMRELKGSRYLSSISVDEKTKTVSFHGQANTSVTIAWSEL